MIKAIREFLEAGKCEIISELCDFVRIPSVASSPVNGAVFGSETRNMLIRCREAFASAGLDLRIQPDSAYATARTDGNDKLIGIFAHGDVVSAVEEDWIVTKPFEPLVKDGFLYGRGAEDNKSGVISALWAYKALKYADMLPKSSLLFYIGANEEGGMQDIEYFEKREQMPDFSIVPDASYPVCRGEKGIMRFWADFKIPFENIISIHGGESLNIVLGSVECEMKYSFELEKELSDYCNCKDEYTLTVGDTIILKSKGKSTHAAHSENSVNAFYVLAKALVECPSLGGDIDIIRTVVPALSDPFSMSLGLDTNDSDFGATTCTNGIVKTVDSCLSLSFDTRYGTEVNPEKIIDGYKKYFNANNADIRVTERDDGYSIPENDSMVLAMSEAYTEITGEVKKAVLMGGGTYARHLKNAVSVGTVISEKEKPALPDGHGGVHQSDEAIDVDGIIKSIEVIAHMIIKADKILNK